MKIQVDTTKELNDNLKIEKIKRGHKTIAETVVEICREYFQVGGQK